MFDCIIVKQNIFTFLQRWRIDQLLKLTCLKAVKKLCTFNWLKQIILSLQSCMLCELHYHYFIKEIVSVPCRLSRGSGFRAVTVSAEATGGTQNSRPATIATQKASVRVRAHHAEWRSASMSRYCDYQSLQGMIVIRKYTDMIAVIGRLKQ